MKSLLNILISVTCLIGLIYFTSFHCGCGHKAKLHPPPPIRLATVENLSANVDCNKITLTWAPVFLDNRGQPLEGPVKYLVLRRRGDKLHFPTITPTPTSTITATQTPSSTIDAEIPEFQLQYVPATITAAPTATSTPTSIPTSVPAATPVVNSTTTPSATPTGIIQPEFEFKLIAIVPGENISSIGIESETAQLKCEDSGLPGAIYQPGLKFKSPKQFPPEKTDYDLDLIPGYSYFYKIQAVGSDRKTSEHSNTLEIKYFTAPGAPIELDSNFDEDGVNLLWQPPQTDCLGADPEKIGGYYIERAISDMPDSFMIIATLDSTVSCKYTDFSHETDLQYIYRISAYTLIGKIQGLPSNTVTVSTRDTFPPKSPQHLNIAYSPGKIHLNWDPSKSKDVAGYKIYRKDTSSEEFTCLNTEILKTDITFVDNNVVSGRLFSYRVTAVDTSEEKNESEPSETVKIITP